MRKLLALTLLALAGVSLYSQELIPGTARLIVKDEPGQTSGYICPMHPNEVKAEPGNCSICGMALVPGDPAATADYHVHIVTEPRAPKAGEKTTFRLSVDHPVSGARVKDFAEVHDRLFHLFIISRDMTQFFHEHPVPQKDGSFTITHVLPKPGQYVLFSDFMPVGGGPQLITTPIVTAGYEGDIASALPNLKDDGPWSRTIDGVTVTMQMQPAHFIAGDELDIPIHFEDDATKTPVTDLQRYLGAFGHAMMLSEDMMEHVHAHPAEMLEGTTVTSGGGPDLTFHALFPKPGFYRIWLQFQRRDKLSTMPFTVRVRRMGEPLTTPQ
jgi:hypothetical protein